MTLREQFEKDISDKYPGNTMMILFEQRLENYVKWLENLTINSEENIKSAIAFGYNAGFYNGRNNENYSRPDKGEDYDNFKKELK